MNRGSPWWVLAAAALVLGLGLAWWKQRRALDELEADRERLAGEVSVLRQRVGELKSETAQRQGGAGAAPSPLAASLSPEELREQELKGAILAILARQAREPRRLEPPQHTSETIPPINPILIGDPVYRELVTQARRLHWQLANLEAIELLKLPPEVGTRWAELRVAQEIAVAEVQARWNLGGHDSSRALSPEDRDRYNREVSEPRSRWEPELRELLGESTYVEYRRMFSSLSVMSDYRVAPTVARAAYGREPLAPAQVAQLRALDTALRTEPPSGLTSRQVNDRFLARAGAVLTPGQVQVARRWLEDWQAWQDESLASAEIRASVSAQSQADAAARERARKSE